MPRPSRTVPPRPSPAGGDRPGPDSARDAKLIELARDLRGALAPVVEAIAGPGARPALLVHRLEIDRSLAGRITRALRYEDDLECLHLLPAPTGLRIFLEAAARAGIDAELLRIAETSVDRFHALIDETPGGRGTLHAGISAHSRQARERNEKSAKQAVYKAMSYLLGVQCDGIASAFILQPATDGQTVDCIDLNLKVGIRRLRPTAPVGLAGYRVDPVDGAERGAPPLLTLDGKTPRNAEDLVLEEFSSDSRPSLESFEADGEVIFALSEDGPSPRSPLTLALGMVFPGALRRYRSPEGEDDYRTYSLPFPCRTLVRDVFIHRDLFGGRAPELTQYMPRMMRPQTVRYRGIRGRLDSVDMEAPVAALGEGLDHAPCEEIPEHERMLANAFTAAGRDPHLFRGYRVTIRYPVPFIYMSWWFRQTDAPGDEPGPDA